MSENVETLCCGNCGAGIEDGNDITLDGEPHCQECVTECESCCATILCDDANIVSRATICDSCVWTCDHCQTYRHPNAPRWTTHDGRDICERCVDDYGSCDSCGDFFDHDDLESDDDGDTYCRECRPATRTISGRWKTKDKVTPLPSPLSRAFGNRYFGVELEVENNSGDREANATRIAEWVNNQAADITADGHREPVLFFEEDGSLDDGFEMISAPMGLDDQRKLWKVALSPSMVRNLRSHDTTTCGLHVHVSRTGLTDLQISKAVCFINDPDNRQLIEAIARRYDVGYCRVMDKKLGNAHKNDGNRYQAVNLCNRATIEFRIFRGTLRYASVIAAVEFCHAVLSFCDSGSGAGFNLKTPAFLDFINSAAIRKHTAYLRMYLADKLPGLTLPAGFRPVNL